MMEKPASEMTEQEIRKQYGISDMNALKKDSISVKRSELLWGIVLYGIIMWASGFVWAGMVL
jgi:hypothetical protein